jgi:lipid A ethanolaminephosphotransferase
MFDNYSFYKNVLQTYPITTDILPALFSLCILLAGLIIILLTIISSRYIIKPVLIFILIISSFAAYFMDTYNVVIDDSMIQNIVSTDLEEASDLFNVRLIPYLVFLGLLPSLFVYKTQIIPRSFKREFTSRLILIMASITAIISVYLLFGNFYASFIREHKPLRYYSNPTYYIYSAGKYINGLIEHKTEPFKMLGRDASIPATDLDRELVILVIGETARADRFSLNGYPRETNPLLKQEDVINFTHVQSCGTSTAISVPCMFSVYDRETFTVNKAKSGENILDVLQHAGVNVLWRDNNSDSKNVATRVTFEDYKNSDNNPVCDSDGECRDEGMLASLQNYINEHPEGDILIVLHQMGNHGPAYYKRYPESFKKFTPVCETNQLQECSIEEINNAYDNAILYTDYFLSKVIDFLKPNSNKFEAAMLYVSDHGESLGEKGLYLHGLPYIFAPEAQTHVPMIMWFGNSFHINKQALQQKSDHSYSHDNLFHTLLGLFEIKTTVYNKQLDIIHSQ